MYASYTTQAREIGKELQELSGELSLRQLWLVVRLAKLVRRSCRQNTAFNLAMTAAFPYARFSQVEKTNARGERYPGLQITVNGESFSGGNDSED